MTTPYYGGTDTRYRHMSVHVGGREVRQVPEALALLDGRDAVVYVDVLHSSVVTWIVV